MTSSRLIRVLLVDDEDSFRLSIELALKMTDQFSVQSCGSGEAALELLKSETFDVVLLDNKMEDMSGLDVLQWMHQQGIQTPSIMVTAAGSETVAVEAMKLGVYDYLRKDQLDIDRLRMAIKSVRERHQYRVEAVQREAEKTLLAEKQKELESLRLYHATVNSVGQLLEKNLSEFEKNLERYELELSDTDDTARRSHVHQVFRELRQTVEVIASGISSMRGLSSVVTHRLDGINLVPKDDSAS